MRRFLSPRWLLAHAVLLVVVAACVSLGLWQLRRLEDRRALNARIEAQRAQPTLELRAPSDGKGSEFSYRTVAVRGEYDTDREVLLAGRSLDGNPGHHVLTPLVSEEGWGVVVERGWVPYELDDPPVAPAAPPAGEARVEGTALPSAEGTGDGTASPGAPSVIGSPDVSVVAAGAPYAVHPFYVRLAIQSPPQRAELPVVVPAPELTEGPHLGYAVQWFLFGATAVGVYAALVRRDLRAGS